MLGEGTSLWAQEMRQRRLRVRRAALLAVLAAALLGLYLFMRSPYFALDHLRIRGYQRLDPATIRDWAGIPPGTLIWRVDPGAVARRLEAHPRVAGAEVRWEWPRGLIIEIQERPAVAVLVDPAGRHWAELDAQGRILGAGRGTPALPAAVEAGATPPAGDGKGGAGGGEPGSPPGSPVPLLTWAEEGGAGGAGIPPLNLESPLVWDPGRFVPAPLTQAAGVAAVLAQAGLPDPPRRLVVGQGPVLVIQLASGVPVRWGLLDGEVVPRVRALAAALVALQGEAGPEAPAYIDVTDPDRPVLGPRRADPGR
ncbi:FtsQ-type POTRA domain-containing protein [Thermaerobacter sp. PB12/4term]|nr:FtsQ-type POTRA domain-containing protein [Thermaerobacter sp. PB12/4term]